LREAFFYTLDILSKKNKNFSRGFMKKIFLVLFFLSLSTEATELNCEIQVNSKVIQQSRISSSANEKVLVGKNSYTSAYITEKENHMFQLEAFLPDYEARVYAQGVLNKSSDLLSLSLWGRDSLIEITCGQQSKNSN
jgi:hypothetical protein